MKSQYGDFELRDDRIIEIQESQYGSFQWAPCSCSPECEENSKRAWEGLHKWQK